MINAAINQTLSRTVLTSLTVFLVVAVLFVFGGEVLRDFAFVLLVGVVVGDLLHGLRGGPDRPGLGGLEPAAPAGRSKKAVVKAGAGR